MQADWIATLIASCHRFPQNRTLVDTLNSLKVLGAEGARYRGQKVMPWCTPLAEGFKVGGSGALERDICPSFPAQSAPPKRGKGKNAA